MHFLVEGILVIELNLKILLLENPSDSIMFMISFGRWLTIYVSNALVLRLSRFEIGVIAFVLKADMHIRKTIAIVTTILLSQELRG